MTNKNYNFQYYSPKIQRFKSETKDCTVRALSKMIDDDYETAHFLLEQAGRKFRSGFNFEVLANYLNSEGLLKTNKLEFSWSGLGVLKMTPTKFCQKYNTGKYVVRIDRHVFAVINGVVFDSWKFRPGTRVYTAWEFV